MLDFSDGARGALNRISFHAGEEECCQLILCSRKIHFLAQMSEVSRHCPQIVHSDDNCGFVQCGLLVAGLWGIVLLDEVAKPCIPAYLMSGICLVFGAAFLALAK